MFRKCEHVREQVRRNIRFPKIRNVFWGGPGEYLMRAMLVANIDVENRFANGTQGRIVQWSPDLGIASAPKLGKRKKLGPEDDTPRVTAGDAEVMVRFVHEHALREDRREWVSGVDFIDITPRSEEVPKAKGCKSGVNIA